jgi:hypothetical protein
MDEEEVGDGRGEGEDGDEDDEEEEGWRWVERLCERAFRRESGVIATRVDAVAAICAMRGRASAEAVVGYIGSLLGKLDTAT